MRHIFLLLVFWSFASCTREVETGQQPELEAERLTELMPLQTGKYITYRLDSLVFTALGTKSEIRGFAVKYLIDTIFKDNLGQNSYRVLRFINDSLASGTWQPAGTGYITPYPDRIETVEDNLRTIALVKPVREGTAWKGNLHLSSNPYGLSFTDMQQWVFTYGAEGPETIGGKRLDAVRMVLQSDKRLNALYDRPIQDTLIGHNITSVAGYAKNIGLVYKELTLWEAQNMLSVTINPATGDTVRSYKPYRTGFGIKMWMTGHN
jgi:hypothetical protein